MLRPARKVNGVLLRSGGEFGVELGCGDGSNVKVDPSWAMGNCSLELDWGLVLDLDGSEAILRPGEPPRDTGCIFPTKLEY